MNVSTHPQRKMNDHPAVDWLHWNCRYKLIANQSRFRVMPISYTDREFLLHRALKRFRIPEYEFTVGCVTMMLGQTQSTNASCAIYWSHSNLPVQCEHYLTIPIWNWTIFHHFCLQMNTIWPFLFANDHCLAVHISKWILFYTSYLQMNTV